MQLQPKIALEVIAGLLSRLPMSPAESLGAQVALDTLKAAVEPKPEAKPEAAEVKP